MIRSASEAGDLLVTGVRVFDGTRVTGDDSVLISNGVIERLGVSCRPIRR